MFAVERDGRLPGAEGVSDEAGENMDHGVHGRSVVAENVTTAVPGPSSAIPFASRLCKERAVPDRPPCGHAVRSRIRQKQARYTSENRERWVHRWASGSGPGAGGTAASRPGSPAVTRRQLGVAAVPRPIRC
jgi:hypothetical protein